LSADPNRPRPRSSKKRRAVQSGSARPSASQRGPATQRVPRGGVAPGRSGGLSTPMLAVIAVVVFGVGVALAGGVFKFGGGATPSSAISGRVSLAPGSSTASGGGIPAGCPTAQPAAAAAGTQNVVAIETPKGTIEVTLKADLSPIAVGNFVALASCGYYDTVVFHRVVPNFVIQAGDGQYARQATYDASRAGTGGPGYEIQDEPVTTLYSRGTVAMARTSAPNSVGSQFFIVLSDDARTSLAKANTYQIIGSVTKGMEVADAIAAAADAENPSEPIPMTKVTAGPATPAVPDASPAAGSPPATSSSPAPS